MNSSLIICSCGEHAHFVFNGVRTWEFPSVEVGLYLLDIQDATLIPYTELLKQLQGSTLPIWNAEVGMEMNTVMMLWNTIFLTLTPEEVGSVGCAVAYARHLASQRNERAEIMVIPTVIRWDEGEEVKIRPYPGNPYLN